MTQSVQLAAQINRTRKVGVEHEMTLPLVGSGTGLDVQRTLACVLSANGLRAIARAYSHQPLPLGVDLAVEYDMSVQGETRYHGISWYSVELKTRILNGMDDWEAVVPEALEICRYMGARVNESTGHHVHLGLPEVRDRPKVVRSLVSLMARIEPVIYGLLPPSRKSGDYSVPLGNDLPDPKRVKKCESIGEFYDAFNGLGRYRGLNLTNVWDDNPHVEFRHHHGTLDPVKARHWLRFLLQLTEHAVVRNCQVLPPLTNDRTGFERLATVIGLRMNSKIYRTVSPELTETASYLLRRWRLFNSQPSL